MKNYISLLAILILASLSAMSQTSMFRQTPEHVLSNAGINGLYDTEDWSFFSGAAIRATPLAAGECIFFGNADGRFFCINAKTHTKKWVIETGSPIHSSAAINKGLVFFADNRSMLYAVNASTGKMAWQHDLGKMVRHEWQYDFLMSSPCIYHDKIFIGTGEGNICAIDCRQGKELWKYNAGAVIRSTPAVTKNGIYFGDMKGRFYCIDTTGKLQWKFSTNGDTLNSADYGFDRNAIISSPAVYDGKVFFGSRDGNMYCLDAITGEKKWIFSYGTSWIIASPCIYGSMVIQGTSDGRFINAIDINSGKELWRCKTNEPLFSSPVIVGNIVYEAGYDGVLYCVDAKSGKRIAPGFMMQALSNSSPVFDGANIYIVSDDGYLHALKKREIPLHPMNTVDSNFVYFNAKPAYKIFKTGVDATLAETLRRRGFSVIDSDSAVTDIMQRTLSDKFKRRIVFATDYFASALIDSSSNSLLRRFMEAGGEVVILGFNFCFLKQVPDGFTLNSFKTVGEILNIDFQFDDIRAFKGAYPNTITDAGNKLSLSRFTIVGAQSSVRQSEVNVVYATNELGEATSWTKFYNNGGKFTQLWMDEFHHPEKMFEVIWKLMEQTPG